MGVPPADSLQRTCIEHDSIMISPIPTTGLINIYISRSRDALIDFEFENNETKEELYKKAGFTMTTDITTHLHNGNKLLYSNCFCSYNYK